MNADISPSQTHSPRKSKRLDGYGQTKGFTFKLQETRHYSGQNSLKDPKFSKEVITPLFTYKQFRRIVSECKFRNFHKH